MKLGEALLMRSDLQKQLYSIKARLAANALFQEGGQPTESPEELIRIADSILVELEALIHKINLANSTGTLRDGTPFTEALTHRDMLLLKHSLINKIAEAVENRPDRYSLKEIRWIPTIDVAVTQKQLADLSREIRELNVCLQEANWRIDI